MSIDPTGKSAEIKAPPGAAATTGPASSRKVFEAGGAPSAESVTRAEAPSPAEQVRSGELEMHAYLELRVQEATRHLEGKLGPADLKRVQGLLRTQLAEDPTLRAMVQAATGVEPPEGTEVSG